MEPVKPQSNVDEDSVAKNTSKFTREDRASYKYKLRWGWGWVWEWVLRWSGVGMVDIEKVEGTGLDNAHTN